MLDIFPHFSILGEVLVFIAIFGLSDLVVNTYLCLSTKKKLIYYISLAVLGNIMMNYM